MKTIPDTTWMDDAACRGMDPGNFVPDRHAFPQITEAARRVCRRCPVKQQCLGYALDLPLVNGIWADTSTKERAAIRRARKDHR